MKSEKYPWSNTGCFSWDREWMQGYKNGNHSEKANTRSHITWWLSDPLKTPPPMSLQLPVSVKKAPRAEEPAAGPQSCLIVWKGKKLVLQSKVNCRSVALQAWNSLQTHFTQKDVKIQQGNYILEKWYSSWDETRKGLFYHLYTEGVNLWLSSSALLPQMEFGRK